ncbi:tRNA (guanine(26)-N(2))-dimethyltransferase [Handroanthus impetiginosus]|uniref:tRNA (guanine(26)-N(2))-dimethyltransferase n=1 Tax=Handroanthus impetiginosus TaxID=429701 RepID=A0A2G9GM61_9LAMI|nr:tRNA (guanine(26)-N(2))-dimethyltransferase [Handroanthus impetiginosus]
MLRSAVVNAGYRISGTHVNPLGLKTDAPMGVIWDIMRCWVKDHPVKPQPPDRAGSVILAKEPLLQANFVQAATSLGTAQAKNVARFHPNPETHWGPKLKAGRRVTSKHTSFLGTEPINITNNHEEGDDSANKHNKMEDPSLSLYSNPVKS